MFVPRWLHKPDITMQGWSGGAPELFPRAFLWVWNSFDLQTTSTRLYLTFLRGCSPCGYAARDIWHVFWLVLNVKLCKLMYNIVRNHTISCNPVIPLACVGFVARESTSLQYLSWFFQFGLVFNQMLPPLPSSLLTLKFGDNFSQQLTDLPPNLTTLHMGYVFIYVSSAMQHCFMRGLWWSLTKRLFLFSAVIYILASCLTFRAHSRS